MSLRPWLTRYQQVCLGHVDGTAKFCRTHFYVVLRSRHTLNAEHSRPLIFDCYGQVGKVVVKVVKSTQCRRSRTATATTDADVRCCRRRIDNRVTAFLWYRLRHCTTRYRQLRPVADLTAPRTSRHRRPDADSEAQSTRRRLHSVADLPAPTTCRRLRHINGATVS